MFNSQAVEGSDEDAPLNKGSGLFSSNTHQSSGGLFGDSDKEDDIRERTESNVSSSKSSSSLKRKRPAGAVPMFGGGTGGGLFGNDDEDSDNELLQSTRSTASGTSKVRILTGIINNYYCIYYLLEKKK